MDLFQHGGLVHLIGNFGDDQQFFPVGTVFNMYPGTKRQFAAAGFISAADLVVVQENAAGGEVRPRKDLHELLQGDLRVIHLRKDGTDGFPKVVSGDVGGETDRNSVGAVDQQIRETGGQHIRFLQGIVKIQPEGNGVLFDIPEHLHGQGRHTGFSIPHGGGTVPVDRTEVSVAVHHGSTHGEILRHMHERAVDGRIPVGMILTETVADDTRAFAVRLVGGGAQFHHGIEDPALNRFEAVLHPGEGTLQDNMFRIGHHAVVHDVFHIDIQDPGGIILRNGLFRLSSLRHPDHALPSSNAAAAALSARPAAL